MKYGSVIEGPFAENCRVFLRFLIQYVPPGKPNISTVFLGIHMYIFSFTDVQSRAKLDVVVLYV